MDTDKIAEFSIIAMVSQAPDSDGNYGEIAFLHIPCGNGINTRSSSVVGKMVLAWMMQHKCPSAAASGKVYGGNIAQPKESEFVCGPDCPKADAIITWDDIVAMYHKLTPPAYKNE